MLLPLLLRIISTHQWNREWEHFDINEPSPYHYQFSDEEIERRSEEAGAFNASQEVWSKLDDILTTEGYTSNETFSSAVQVLKGLRETGLEGLNGKEREEFDKETRYVLDLTHKSSR